MLEVELAHNIIERRLASSIRGARNGELLHVGDRGDASGDSDEFRLCRLLEERVHGLEEHEGPDGVDFQVDFEFLGRGGDRATPVIGDAGVGDHDIEVRDGLLGEAGDCGGWVRGGEGVDLHDDDLAAWGGHDGIESCALAGVADSCDDGVIGTLCVLSDESEADA